MVENDIQITPEKARAMVQSCFEEFKYNNDLHTPFSLNTANPDIEIAEQEILSQAKINDLENQASCRTFNKNLQIRTSEYCQRKHINFDALNAKDQSRLLYAFAQALIEEQRYFQHRLNDPISTYQPYNSIFNNIESEYSHQITQHDKQNIEIGLTIKQAVEKYLNAKKKSWVHKTHKARIWQLRYLIEYIGHDRLMNSIGSSDIREFRDKLIKLRAKHGQGRSLSFFEKLTDNENAQIKNKTARLIYEPTKAFFKWAKSEEGLIEKNPAEDVKWNTQKTEKEPKSRRPFTETELLKLFNSPLYKGCKSKHRRFLKGKNVYKDAKYWIPILGYYTGARLGELVQLHINDVKLDNGIPYLDLNETQGNGDKKHIKTKAGIRRIPLHPDLLELGFINFVEKRQKWMHPSKRLFSEIKFGSDGQASTEFSKIFAYFLDKIDLIDSSITFHSFRHGMADLLRDAEIPMYEIDHILGHDNGTMNAQYGNGNSLETLYNSIKKVKFLPTLADIIKF